MFIENTLKSLKNIGNRIKTAIRKENGYVLETCYLVDPEFFAEKREEERKKAEKELRNLRNIDSISLEIGSELFCLIDTDRGAKLLARVASVRTHIALEMGLIIPAVSFRVNNHIKSNSYIIKIRDIVSAKGEVIPDRFLAIGPEEYLATLEGPRVLDPNYGMTSVWITAGHTAEANNLGTMVFDPVSVISTQITEAIRKYAFEILDYELVLKIIEEVRTYNPLLVEEVYPKSFTLQEIYEVLYNLLKENVSIRDMVTIMETMAHYASVTMDIDSLTECVRQSLCNVISRAYKDDKDAIDVIIIEERLEKILLSLKEKKYGTNFTFPSTREQALLSCIEEQINGINAKYPVPVVLCSSQIRLMFRRLIEKSFPDLAVLSYDEIQTGIKLNTIATLTLSDEIAGIYHNRENLIVSYVEMFHKDSHPSIRCTAIKMINSIADNYDRNKLLSYLDNGLLDEDQNVRLESAGAIKNLFDMPVIKIEDTENLKEKKGISNNDVSWKNPCDKQDGEASGEVEVNKPEFSMKIDLLAMEIGRGLISIVDPNRGQILIERIKLLRRNIIASTGFVMPGIRFRDNLQLKPNEYVIKIRDIQMGKGEVIINKLLAIETEDKVRPLKGPRCFDPVYGKPAVWITKDQKEEAEKSGCKVFEAEDVIAGHIKYVTDKYIAELLDYSEVFSLIEELKETNPLLVEEIYPKLFRITEIHRILKNLLKEKVPVKDIELIMRTLKKYASVTTDINLLTEYVRQSLSRIICKQYQDDKGNMNVIALDEKLEKIFATFMKKNKEGYLSNLDYETEKFILTSLEEHIKAFNLQSFIPVLLCSSQIRLSFRRFTWKSFPELVVISCGEIAPDVKVNNMAVIKLPDEIAKRYSKEERLMFSYIEKFQKDSYPPVRAMAVKMILSISERYEPDKLLSYLNTGLKDEDSDICNESAGAIKELLDL